MDEGTAEMPLPLPLHGNHQSERQRKCFDNLEYKDQPEFCNEYVVSDPATELSIHFDKLIHLRWELAWV